MGEKKYELTEAQALYYDDLKRQKGQRALLFELLQDGKWHPNYECARVGGLSFNDSIFAFRQEGWIIESRRVRAGVWKYRLLGKEEPPTGHKPMTRPQRVVAGHYMHVVATELGDEAAFIIRDALPEWMRAEARALPNNKN